MMKHFPWLVSCVLVLSAAAADEYDVVVYGGTPGGVMAVVEASRLGRSAVLIEPGRHIGGLTSGGLGFVDVGKKDAIGGLAREYFHRVWAHYQRDDAWRWEKRRAIAAQGVRADDPDPTMWVVEPGVAEGVFTQFMAEAKAPVITGERLDRKAGVKKDGARILQIAMESGRIFRGRMFIDATYEGDLLAAAGASYMLGRESNAEFGETLNGIRPAERPFKLDIDPYVIKGNPSSGLLPRILPALDGKPGAADRKVQAYCYRMCLTDVPANRVMIEKPVGYDERQYEIVLRAIEAGHPIDRFFKIKCSMLPNRKTDSNNHGPISTDYVGKSWDYAEADYARRVEIEKEHELWQRGLVWTLQNHPRVPAAVKAHYGPWGLPKDEFKDNGHWSHQLYVREARRLRGEYVVTERDCLNKTSVPDPAGLASYTMDSHYMQYVAGANGMLHVEGGMEYRLRSPYPVSYRALVPKRGECENLLVPVCLSASHAAYGSIRMEPVFMILGQSAAAAASLAIEDGIAVQDVPYARLRDRLLAGAQVLEVRRPAAAVNPAK